MKAFDNDLLRLITNDESIERVLPHLVVKTAWS